MAVVNKMELGRELTRTLNQVNRQMEAMNKVAKEMGIESFELRDSLGHWVMPPLLSAKANLLHALAIINQRER